MYQWGDSYKLGLEAIHWDPWWDHGGVQTSPDLASGNYIITMHGLPCGPLVMTVGIKPR